MLVSEQFWGGKAWNDTHAHTHTHTQDIQTHTPHTDYTQVHTHTGAESFIEFRVVSSDSYLGDWDF